MSTTNETPTKEYVRLSINLNPETAQTLRDLASRRGLSVTDMVRRIVAMAKFIEDEVQAGHRLQVVDNDNHVRELVLV